MPPYNHTNPTKPVTLNDRISVYWPMDDQFFAGVVTKIEHDGKVVVHYDDGDVETLLLTDETWNFVEPGSIASGRVPQGELGTVHGQPAAPAAQPAVSSTAPPVAPSVPQSTSATKTAPPEMQTFTRQGVPSTASAGTTHQKGSPVPIQVPSSRKRPAPSSTSVNPVVKKPATTPIAPAVTIPASTIAPGPPISGKRVSPKVRQKPAPKVGGPRATARPQLARPITSGVPLSGNTPQPPSSPTQQPEHPQHPTVQNALEPLMTSFNAQLNTQVSRISSIRTMLLNLTPRLTELDDRCKTLRADVDNLESEVTSRAEMNKLFNAAFAKQMEELNQSQTRMLERLKKDFRSFLQDEMKAVENHLVEKIRTKSAEVFKELFQGVAESIKDNAVKNAIEDMSIPTNPSEHTSKKQGGGPSRSK